MSSDSPDAPAGPGAPNGRKRGPAALGVPKTMLWRLLPTAQAQVTFGLSLMLAFLLMTWVLYGSLLAGYTPPDTSPKLDAFAKRELDRAATFAKEKEYKRALDTYDRIAQGWATNPLVMARVKEERNALEKRLAEIAERDLEARRQEALAELTHAIEERPGYFETHIQRIAELEKEFPKLRYTLDSIRENLDSAAHTALENLQNEVSLHLATQNLEAAQAKVEAFEAAYPEHPDREEAEAQRQKIKEKADAMYAELKHEVDTYLGSQPRQYVSAEKACERFLGRVNFAPLRARAEDLLADVEQALQDDFDTYIGNVRTNLDRFDFVAAESALADGAYTFQRTHEDIIDQYRQAIPILRRLHAAVVDRIRRSGMAESWALPFIPAPIKETWGGRARLVAIIGASADSIDLKVQGGPETAVYWEDIPKDEAYRIYRHYLPETNEANAEALETFRVIHGLE